MGVSHHDIPVTRDDMYGWIQDWEALPPRRPARKKYLADAMDTKYGEGTSTTLVDTTGHDRFGDEMPLIDMVMSDLDSYG